MHKKHFLVLAKERNTVSYAQETLCCLGKGKKNCFLYIRNTLLSWQKKETLFPMYKKHFVVLAKETLFSVHKTHFVVLEKERNTVFYAQETLYCLGKRKKHCFLCLRHTLLSQKKKETLFSMHKKHFVVLEKEILFPMHKKHFVVLAKERNTVSCT